MLFIKAGCALKNNKSAVRFLAAVWCLMAVILINYYNSTLISYMLVPKYEPIVNTIEELAHSTKLSVSAEKSSVIGDTIFVTFIIKLKILKKDQIELIKMPIDLIIRMQNRDI